ncbi:MAG: phenylalanine--tRNA ligase subunit beta [Clostridiales bacterium]|nr:phenylalanine--tRNA ligase subunit beta [Clostridiales bacterium]
MYISLNWIKDYVNLDGIDVNELINKFTLSCAEVEGVEIKGGNVSGVITAKIEKVEEHPNSKKLHLLKVNTGKDIIDIVCGAPNVAEGIVVPLATIGANVCGINISKAVVGGYDSYGMCCSAKELGISDDHSGLYVFEDGTPIGVDVKEILDIDDVVFEVDNKSLTNRPDMWGHYGIAREISAITGRELRPLILWDGETNGKKLDITVNTDKCYRYTSATMGNITRKVSPINMQIRLYYAGMRGVNFLADVTNYVMLELGQPMHAFDNAIVDNIEVNELAKEAKFVTLDSQERMLPAHTMVIANDNKPVAVAGIMGGENSEITDDTTSVLIESACFDGTDVRKTATKLGLRTEASARYEKMLDTQLTETALRRFMQIVVENDENAEVTSDITDIVKYTYPEVVIDIDKAYIDKYIGISIPEERIISILESLTFKVENMGDGLYSVTAPSFRTTKDIQGKADLIEEITRVYGYDNIPATSTTQPVVPMIQDKSVDLEYDTKYALATRYNYSEVHSYIWNDYNTCNELGINPPSYMNIVNALQKDNNQIRSTIIPSLMKVVMDNKNDLSGEVQAFEIGRVVTGLNDNGLCNEEKSLGIIRSTRGTMQDALISLKEAVDYIFADIVKAKVEYVKSDINDDLICPVNYYRIVANNINLGYIGIVNPRISKKIDSKMTIVVCEINYTKIRDVQAREYKFEKIYKHPGTELDFNFEIPKTMLYADVEKIATSVDTPLLYKVGLTDIYKAEGSEYANYTLHYSVLAEDHTLTGAEIEEFHANVINVFKANNINLKMN